jgi:hypothetical protein
MSGIDPTTAPSPSESVAAGVGEYTPQPFDVGAAAYQSLAELERAHYQLLESMDASAQVPTPQSATAGELDEHSAERSHLRSILAELQTFWTCAKAAGAYLDEPAARRSAQAKLDYWTSQCYGAGWDYPRYILAPHDPNLLPELKGVPCPYRGLDPFAQEDSLKFFGRDDHTAVLVRRLNDGDRLIVVTGLSGSGKSSLVFAGLLEAVACGAVAGSEHWRALPPLVPGTTPLRNLLHALKSLCPRLRESDAFEAELGRLRANPLHLAALLAEGQPATADEGVQPPALLVVDQFEEAVVQRSTATEADFDAFVAALLGLIACDAPPHRVVLTMRDDSMQQVAAIYPELNRRFGEDALYPVVAMDPQQLRAAIEGPANAIGLRFQDGVVEDLVNSVRNENAGLPLLQFTLMALWEKRPKNGNLILRDTLREVGSPRTAMADAAEKLYTTLPLTEEQQATKDLLLALTRSEGASTFRNRVPRGHLARLVSAQSLNTVLNKFAEARLLRVSGDPLHPSDDDLVDVAHEALLRNWTRLHEWVRERQHQLEQRAFLRRLANHWQAALAKSTEPASERGADYLLTGLALEQANREFKGEALEPLEREFIEASQKAEDRRKQRLEAEAAERDAVASLREAAAAEREAAAAVREAAAAQSQAAAVEREAAATEREANKGRKAELVARRRRQTRRILFGVVAACLVSLFAFVLAWHESAKNLKHAKDEVANATRAIEDANEIVRKARLDAARASEEATKKVDKAEKDATEKIKGANRRAEKIEKDAKVGASKAELARSKAVLERDEARGDTRITEARLVMSTNSDLAIWSAMEAVKLNPKSLQSAFGPLVEALRYRRAAHVLTKEQLGPSRAIALSPDGQRMLVVGPKELTEWTIDTAKRHGSPRPWPTGEGPREIYFAGYAPRGPNVAVASDNGVWLWRGDELPTRLSEGNSEIRLRFDPDGHLLAGVDRKANRVLMWNVASGQQLLDHQPFAGSADLADADLDNATFVEASGQRYLVAVAATIEPGQRVRQAFAAYALHGNKPDSKPRVDMLPPCMDGNYIHASGGHSAGVSLPERSCIHRLDAVLAKEPSAVEPPWQRRIQGLHDIVFSADGRQMVQLMRDTTEARYVNLDDGRALRLQGAFDLGPRINYETVLSISANGARMAIKTAGDSVRVFDLVGTDLSAPIGAPTVWVSPDETLRLVTRSVHGQPAMDLLQMPGGTPVKTIRTADLPVAPNDITLSADRSRLTFLGVCQKKPGEARTTNDRCVSSIDVLADTPTITHRFSSHSPSKAANSQFLMLATPVRRRSGDLLLVQQESNWQVVRGSAAGTVLEMPFEHKEAGQPYAEPPITLGSDRVFAVQRRSAEGTRIEIHDVVGAQSIPRPGTLNYPAGELSLRFEDGGQFLVVSQRSSTGYDSDRVSLHDLRRPLDEASAPLPAETVADHVKVDSIAGTLAVGRIDQPWQVFRLPAMELIGTLPDNLSVDAKGRYAWGPIGQNRWELRAIKHPAKAILSFTGSVPRLTFSEDGNVVAIRMEKENRLLLHRLPAGDLLLDVRATDLPLRQNRWLTGRGGWLLDADDRLIPADPQRLLEMARSIVKR